jgi:DNA polymerase V
VNSGHFVISCSDDTRELRRTVGQWTGNPASVGIAPTNLLAIVTNRFAKKEAHADGVKLLLDPAAQADALARIELTDLWGIARRLAVRLKDDGISTPLELRAADPQALRQRFGG